MEGKVKITVRTATRDRQSPIAVTDEITIGEILQEAQKQWNLSKDYEYIVRCERLGSQLSENSTISQAGIVEDDVLEIQPLADAGMLILS